MISYFKSLIKNKLRNCSPICAHCEVEISERTALVISKMIDKRIEQLSENIIVVSELKLQRDQILSGTWHDEYEKISKEIGENYDIF